MRYKYILLSIIVFTMLANSASATTTISNILVNSTNISATDYVIGNIGLCIGSICKTSWLFGFNQSYHDFWIANYSAKTDYVNNVSERSLFISTFNSTYDAKPNSTFNSSYHNNMIANYSAKTDYVNNASERTLFLSTYNSSYAQKDAEDTIAETWTFLKNIRVAGNITYVNYDVLNVNGTIQPPINNIFDIGNQSFQWANIYGINLYQNNNLVLDTSTGYLRVDVYNTTQSDIRYLQSEALWQGNSSSVLTNISNLLSSNASTNQRIDNLAIPNISSKTCSGLDKVSAINNITGEITCSADTGISFNQSYHDFLTANYSAKTDYVNNATERGLFTITFNATYDAKPSSTYNTTYDSYITANISNSTIWWYGLSAPLSIWTDTYNSSYHNNMIANYSAKTDYMNNASERTLFLSTFNSSYLTSETLWQGNSSTVARTGTCGANQYASATTTSGITCGTPIDTNTYNTTSEMKIAINNSGYYNISINSSNVLNIPDSWTSTFNASYITNTFNSSYHNNMIANYSAKTDYVNNATERGLFTTTFNSSYLTSETLWQGNSSAVLGWNKTYADTLYYAITNPYKYWNSTWAGFNKTYADTLYMTNTFNQTYHNWWISNYSAKTDYVNNASERTLFTSTFNSSYLTSYTETDPRWSGNATTVLNWNKTYADTLYYGITNPYGYYNSSTIPAYALIINLVGYLGNWSADKSSYATSASLTSVGNWTNDRSNYINTTRAWTNDTNVGINGVSLIWIGTLADGRIASATTWNAKAGTGVCSAGQYTSETTTGGVTCSAPPTFNSSYHNNMIANYSAKTDYVNNATERSLFTTTFNASYMTNTFNTSYHNFWLTNYSAKTDYMNNATERTLFLSTFNSSYLTSTSAVTTALTGIGTQAQNMNIGTKNITNVTFVNVTNQINVANNLIINGTAICKSGGGCILFT